MELKINDRIRVRTINFFNSSKITIKFDSIASTFSFKFYFDPKNKDHAELACVSHFHEAWIEHKGERLLTGYILSNAFNSASKNELVEIGGYSKSGLLEDCDIPSSQPLEWNGLTLTEITQKVISVFKSIKLKVDSTAEAGSKLAFTDVSDPTIDDNGEIANDDAGKLSVTQSPSLSESTSKKIDKASAKHPQNIKSLLTLLATQRNILLSHDEFGNLLFTQAKTNQSPVLNFDFPNGISMPGTSMHLTFNGQAIHSHITVVGQQDTDEGNSPEFTIQNPYCPIVYRPKVVGLSSGTDITIEEAARQALSAELKTGIILTVTLDRWDVDGKLIKPNNVISVLNPECFLYKKTEWFIESIEYTSDAKGETAVLTCVLPEVYNKESVKNVFVDPHNNLPRF